MAKRYVLFVAPSPLSEDDVSSLGEVIRQRHGAVKVIPVKGNAKAVIVKTTNEIAPRLRDARPGLKVGNKELVSVMTSGAIGNLKRRASSAAADG